MQVEFQPTTKYYASSFACSDVGIKAKAGKTTYIYGVRNDSNCEFSNQYYSNIS